MTFLIPKEVSYVTKTLKKANFEAFLIGGCVRDLILNRTPADWDVTTNATPDEIITLFPHTFYENNFGTVGVVSDETEDERLKSIEVTTYRQEATYSDYRKPDQVSFSKNLEDDLKRRDFTVNAIAYDAEKESFTDPYSGKTDIEKRLLRTVGTPSERFSEDALRIMRAVRLSAELDFTIEENTEKAIQDMSHLLSKISMERIRDEFIRIILSDRPMEGLLLAKKLTILEQVLPEILAGAGITQNQAHAFDVLEHSLRTLAHAAKKNFPLSVRLAALFHDIAKPETRRKGQNGEWTFYGHEVVGSRVTRNILTRMRFPKETIEEVSKLVRWHMFFSDPEKVTLAGVRRLIRNVEKERVENLMNLRICDRIGTGRPKEEPYRLRKYQSMIEEAMRDPLTVSMLHIDGEKIMEISHETPGPRIGLVLHALLEEVLDDPSRNTKEYLEKRAQELLRIPQEELRSIGEQGKMRRNEEEEKTLTQIRNRFHVK